MRAALGLVVVGLVVVISSSVWASTVEEVSSQVMSPYCPGVTLHDCASREALELREQIDDWAQAGMTSDQILDRLVAEFGPSIRAVPDRGIPVWVVPLVAVVTGGLLAARLARRWMGSRKEPREVVDRFTSEERARLSAALEELRQSP